MKVTISGSGTREFTKDFVYITVYGKYWHDIKGSTCPILARSDPSRWFRQPRGFAESKGMHPCPECAPTQMSVVE
jgi:hypothetical protein